MIDGSATDGDGRFLGIVTAAACHDLMNIYATFTQAFGLMEDCLAADTRTRLKSLGFKGGFEHKERFGELLKMMRGQLARAVGLTDALALAAHSLERGGRPASPPEAIAAMLLLCERLLKRRKLTVILDTASCAADQSWPVLRQVDYLGPLTETLLACLPHVPMGSELRLSCQAEAGSLRLVLGRPDGGFAPEARAACQDVLDAAPGATLVCAAPDAPLTLIFQEQPTSTPASCPPGAGQAS